VICAHCNVKLKGVRCRYCGRKGTASEVSGFVGHAKFKQDEPDYGSIHTVNIRLPIPKMWHLQECATPRERLDKRIIRLRGKANRFGKRRATTK